MLVENGYAAARAAGNWEVTQTGRERVVSLRRRANAFEAAQLKDFSADDIETTRKVLRALGIPHA